VSLRYDKRPKFGLTKYLLLESVAGISQNGMDTVTIIDPSLSDVKSCLGMLVR
jgi:hypothetical protein